MSLTKRILIDAAHGDTTRIAVVDQNNRLEEFELDVAGLRQTKGNIYIGYISRIEPSLQAAFVDYGGTRHGFLSLYEVHPDYFHLSAEQLAQLKNSRRKRYASFTDDAPEAAAESEEPEGAGAKKFEEDVDFRDFLITDILKAGQPVVVQVVKEERGQKGAFLTTYLSLAGRYCIFMPNTFHAGGVSKKIASGADRQRLKKLIQEAALPEDMAVVIRTAGLDRTDTEIYRDMEYLLEIWETIRQKALGTAAPALIYEEADIIKRTVRDLYTRDTKEIVVEGGPAYEKARDVIQQMIPSQIRKLTLFKPTHTEHIFDAFLVETQLKNLLNPKVPLPSGGYLVINTTEALVAIDINSGKANKGRDIEHTALQTNLEAADEIARQLRLQNIGGLVVIDFIDMQSSSNQRSVENRLKGALKADRARIQLSRLSQFGLMELSRQRIRRSMVENRAEVCPTCRGRGIVISSSTLAEQALRALESHLQEGLEKLTVSLPPPVALYVLNHRRQSLLDFEKRFGCFIHIEADPHQNDEEVKIEATRLPQDDAAAPARRSRELKAPQAPAEDPAGAPQPSIPPPAESAANPSRRHRNPPQAAGRRRGPKDTDKRQPAGHSPRPQQAPQDSESPDKRQPAGHSPRPQQAPQDSESPDKRQPAGRSPRRGPSSSAPEAVPTGFPSRRRSRRPSASARGGPKESPQAEASVTPPSATEGGSPPAPKSKKKYWLF